MSDNGHELGTPIDFKSLSSDQLIELLNSKLNHLTSESKEKVRDYLLEIIKDKARENFYMYVLLMAPHCLPEEFVSGRHIEIICDELQKIEQYVMSTRRNSRIKKPKGSTGRLQIFLSPGSMKSVLGSRLFASWVLGRHPKWRIMAVGHSREFTIDNVGKPIRDIMSTEEYKEIFPSVSLAEDLKASGRWETNHGGQFYAAGAGTRIAGRRAHIAIMDDVISEQEADSETQRVKINRWYGKGLQSRLLPGAAEVIINTRWHIDDLSGYTERAYKASKRPFRIVSIPALLTIEASELLRRPGDPEHKYAVGTSYWPEFWSTEALMDIKTGGTISPSEWNALYMQNPVAEEGNIVKWKDFQTWEYDQPPECSYVLLSLDTAFETKKTSDYSAYELWGIFSQKETFDKEYHQGTPYYGAEAFVNNMILLAADKGKYEFPDLCNHVHMLYKKFKPDVILIEKKASGISLIQELRRRGLPVIEYLPDRDKMSRLHATTPFLQTGRVWIPKATETRAYVTDLVSEIVSFPYASHDDYVDAFSQAVLWMRDHYQLHHEGFQDFMEDEDEMALKNRRKTYWSVTTERVAK